MTYIVISKEEKTMATALLTQKYTNDVQTNSQKHFGYLTPRMYAYRDKVLNKNRSLP